MVTSTLAVSGCVALSRAMTVTVRVGGRVEDRAARDCDLTFGVYLEGGRIGARETVRERVVLVGVRRLDGVADGVAFGSSNEHGAFGRGGGEGGGVVDGADRDSDPGVTSDLPVRGGVGEGVCAVVVGIGCVGDVVVLAAGFVAIHRCEAISRLRGHADA